MVYNPNAVWTSKKKTYGATPVSEQSSPSPETPRTPPPPESPKEIERPSPDKKSTFRRYGLVFFGAGLIVLIGVVLLAVYFLRPPSTPSVSITFSEPSSTPMGVPLILGVSATNNSNTQLTGATLTVVLPDGISFVGDDPSERTKGYPLDDIATSTTVNQTSTIIVTSDPESLKRINIKLTYTTPANAKTQFENDAQTNLLTGDAAVGLNYNAPSSIVSGQNFTFTVNYQNLTNQAIDNATIQANFPPAFTFVTSSIPLNNNTWDIESIPAGANGSFTVNGAITGPAQAQYQVSETLFTEFLGQHYAVNNQSFSIAVIEPPLSLSMVPNNSSHYISGAGDSLTYNLNYANNSKTTFAGVKISVNLLGSMFDFSSLQTSGVFDSKSDTITWYAANTPDLASLAPGQSGSVSFSIATKGSFPITLPSDKDYTLNATGIIQSPTVLPNTAGTSTVSVINLQTKVGGEVGFTSAGYWESGPYPPKVDKETYYSMRWAITNYSTDIQNVTVSAYLESGSTLTGTMTSTISSTPSYNSDTGLITWTIPAIAAGIGVIPGTKPVEADFVISNIPAANQIGKEVTLIGKTSLAATDAFTQQSLSLTTDPITTLLPNDPRVAKEQHTVIQ